MAGRCRKYKRPLSRRIRVAASIRCRVSRRRWRSRISGRAARGPAQCRSIRRLCATGATPAVDRILAAECAAIAAASDRLGRVLAAAGAVVSAWSVEAAVAVECVALRPAAEGAAVECAVAAAVAGVTAAAVEVAAEAGIKPNDFLN
jgi:hypothetical protein